MKLNYKRTLFVGFAFFLICAFWQAYDAIVPLMLVNKFGLNQTWSGIVMSIDNILALFMLPLFGALSDKRQTKWGKRKPFVVIGTVIAILCFVGLTVADNAQLSKVSQGTNDMYWQSDYTISNSEYESVTNKGVPQQYSLRDYASQMLFGSDFSSLTTAQQAQVESWYKALDTDSVYFYNKTTNTYQTDKSFAEVEGFRQYNAFTTLVSPARSAYAWEVTQGQIFVLVIFVFVLLLTLISMATFRSPAVALMPDVTVKPLRSKANAIINLMGTTGGILVLVLGMVFGTSSVKNQVMSYTGYICAVGAIMIASLVAFMLLVKEKAWNAEMLAKQAELDSETAKEMQQNQPEGQKTEIKQGEEKLSKEQLKSLILILSSVALWFIGYNAITTKYSLYAINVIETDFNMTLLIAQGAAIVSYVPVGIVATKIGRKRTILIGIAMLTTSFALANFVTAHTPNYIMYILFALAGIAWATINVNSFPMVVELSQGGSIGKYTGYYYTASMSAQILTPILSGALMDWMGTMRVLFPYGAIFVALSFVTMCFVKFGDSKPDSPKSKLEMLGGADD